MADRNTVQSKCARVSRAASDRPSGSDEIVRNLHHAYRERAQFARYGVFMTGPSATADIEGVLIHGAQGIRTLTVVLLAESAR